MSKEITYVFFGTGALAESVLAALVNEGYMPTLLVTKADSQQGRHMQLTAPHIKTWAQMKGIEVFQPESLKALSTDSPLHCKKFDLYIVASYGKIIPDAILNLPTHGTLNVHPSLLPKYRGPSPIETSLLDGDMTTGVTIIKLDSEMDHGQILAQTSLTISPYANAGTLEVTCGQIGGELLVSLLPHYIDGVLILKEQEHDKATICKKITKEDGLLDLSDDPVTNDRKYRAYMGSIGTYFFTEKNGIRIRAKITKAHLTNEQFVIDEVIPENGKRIPFSLLSTT